MFKTQEYNAVLWKLCQAFSCIAKIQVGRPLHWYQARGCLYVHVRYNKCTMTYSKNMAALEVVCAEVVGAVPQKVVVFKGPSVSCIEESEVCCILRKYAAASKWPPPVYASKRYTGRSSGVKQNRAVYFLLCV